MCSFLQHTGEKPYVCGICGDRFIQGTALAAHRRMQSHFEDNQPAPFASISVNNPSRFTNANRVNRIGFMPPQVKQRLSPELPSSPPLPQEHHQQQIHRIMIPSGPKPDNIVQPHTPSVPSAASSPNPSASSHMDIGSPNSNSMHSNSMPDHGVFPPHRLPPHLAGVQTPHGLTPFMTPNGVQFLSHLDVSGTVLSLAPFNHPNFN